MQRPVTKARAAQVAAMVIFGTIGIFRTYIALPSGLLAAARGMVGALFLTVLLYLRGQRLNRGAIRANLGILLVSGVVMGLNWVLLFEAYRYTTVATATLCYYMAPVFVLLASPLLLGTRMTLRAGVCAALAFLGMIPVSGVLSAGFGGAHELRGVALGLGAAVLYATVVLLNQKLKDIGPYDRTIVQLASAGAALIPYTLIAEPRILSWPDVTTLGLTVVVCLLHTGVAYALYFGSMAHLSAQSVALMGYIDPVVAVLLSCLVLHQLPDVPGVIGAVLILGATVINEWPTGKRKGES